MLQVHEKSILMPMLPLALLYVFEPVVAALVLPLAAFSMFPLLERDGQLLPYVALTSCAAAIAPDLAAAWPALKASAPQHPQQENQVPDQPGAGKASAGLKAVARVGGRLQQPERSHGPVSLWQRLQHTARGLQGNAIWMAYRGSCAIGAGLHVARVVYPPPERIKFLHDLLMTVFAFCHFALVMLYCNWRQLKTPADGVGL